LGLLIEEQRTNLVLRSEEFETTWANSGSVDQPNQAIAPDGTITADLLTEDTSTGSHEISQSVTLVASTTYALSVYAKAYTRSQLRIAGRISGSWSPLPQAIFDLSAGTVVSSSGTSSATIQDVGNGWYRCTIVGTTSATNAGMNIGIANGGSSSYTGDGFSGIFIWGAQLEAGSFPTSYIPTVASQVTRSGDAASMTGANFSSWYRADEGTLYGEYTSQVVPTSNKFLLSVSDGTTSNFIGQRILFGNGAVQVATTTNGVAQSAMSSITVTTPTPFKLANAYRFNDEAASTNGATALTDTSSIVPVVNQMFVGGGPSSSSSFVMCGTIRKVAFYPKRLADAELQALTQI
jgi:hypothetical protein